MLVTTTVVEQLVVLVLILYHKLVHVPECTFLHPIFFLTTEFSLQFSNNLIHPSIRINAYNLI